MDLHIVAATEGLQKRLRGGLGPLYSPGKMGRLHGYVWCVSPLLPSLSFLSQLPICLEPERLNSSFLCLSCVKVLGDKSQSPMRRKKIYKYGTPFPAVVLGTGKPCGEAMESRREIRHWEHVTDDRENDERARIEVQMAGASGAYGHCRPVALRLLTVLRLLKLPKHILSDNFVCAKGHMILFFSVNVPLIWLFLVSGWGCGR